MTSWEHHRPPPDHPDFDAYLNTLSEDHLAAINAATLNTYGGGLDTRNDFREN